MQGRSLSYFLNSQCIWVFFMFQYLELPQLFHLFFTSNVILHFFCVRIRFF